MVRDTGGIRLENAMKFLGVDGPTLMKVAGILSEHDIVKINYNLVGETVFKPGKDINRKIESMPDKAKDGGAATEVVRDENVLNTIDKTEDKTERVDRMVDEIRRRIWGEKLKKEKPPETKKPT